MTSQRCLFAMSLEAFAKSDTRCFSASVEFSFSFFPSFYLLAADHHQHHFHHHTH